MGSDAETWFISSTKAGAWRNLMTWIGLVSASILMAKALTLSYRHNEAPAGPDKFLEITDHLNPFRELPIVVRPESHILSPAEVTDTDLETILRRMAHPEVIRVQSVHSLLHALRLFEPDQARDEHRGTVSMPAKILLSSDRYRAFTGRSDPMLLATTFGFSARMGTDFDLSTHVDKLLSVMAEIGASSQTSVAISAECERRLAHGIRDAIARFQLQQSEIEWTAVAFAAYLPPMKAWRNQFGTSFSFDDLAVELIRRDGQSTVCYGTHRLMALVYLDRVHEMNSILSPSVAGKVVAALRRASAQLARAQHSSGHWSPVWNTSDTRNNRQLTPNFDNKNLVRATGHHLEWIALSRENCRPPRDVILAAARCTVVDLLDLTRYDAPKSYGPLSHAACALCLLRNVAPSKFVRLPRDESKWVAKGTPK